MNTYTLAGSILAAYSLGIAFPASAQTSYAYQTIDVPGVTDLEIHGSNDLGQFVGAATAANGQRQGFTLLGGVYSTFAYPGAVTTDILDINNHGEAIGLYSGADKISHGFTLQNGIASSFDFPGAIETYGIGINDAGVLAGYSADADSYYHGFLLGQSPERVDYPEAPYTFGGAINNNGETGGGYYDADLNSHGFVRLADGTFESFDIPGAAAVYVNHINDFGVSALNAYGDDSDPNPHGFVRSADGTLTSLNAPGAIRTAAWDVDSAGRIAGFYVTEDGLSHGYSATPVPETSSLISWSLLGLGMAWLTRRLRSPINIE